jgi:hypothetical protein
MPYAEAEETAWTLRLRRSLITRLDAEVSFRNAQGEGRWSRNGLVVWLLERGLRDVPEGAGGVQTGTRK